MRFFMCLFKGFSTLMSLFMQSHKKLSYFPSGKICEKSQRCNNWENISILTLHSSIRKSLNYSAKHDATSSTTSWNFTAESKRIPKTFDRWRWKWVRGKMQKFRFCRTKKNFFNLKFPLLLLHLFTFHFVFCLACFTPARGISLLFCMQLQCSLFALSEWPEVRRVTEKKRNTHRIDWVEGNSIWFHCWVNWKTKLKLRFPRKIVFLVFNFILSLLFSLEISLHSRPHANDISLEVPKKQRLFLVSPSSKFESHFFL